MRLGLASRRSGLAAPIDGVTVATQDLVRLQTEALRAWRGDFNGKLCIYPAQVPVVIAVFLPTSNELDWTRLWWPVLTRPKAAC